MKTENAGNGAPSAATSASTPAADPHADPLKNKPDAALSEADYLARQAEQALDAIKHTLARAKTDLLDGVNPVGWAREHPWITLGATAVAGAVATALVVPSKEQTALRRLERIERALHAGRNGNGHEKNDGKSADPAEKPGMLHLLLREAIKTLSPLLTTVISSGVAAATAKMQENSAESGQADGPN